MSKWHEMGKNKSRSSGTAAYSKSWKLRAWEEILPTVGPQSCFSSWLSWRLLVKVKGKSLSHVHLFVTPWTVAYRSSVHGISQARILEWVAISFSRSSQPRD